MEEDAGRAVVEDALDLGRREARIDGYRDGAEARGREDGLDIGAAVAEQDRNPVAALDARVSQDGRAALGSIEERRVVEIALGVDEGAPITCGIGMPFQPAADIVGWRFHARWLPESPAARQR